MGAEENFRTWRAKHPYKSVPIRLASQKDASTWRSLWRGMLFDQEKRGGDFVVTEKTLAFFESLFWAYVRNEVPGVVLLAGWDWATLMWGAPLFEPPFDMRDGPVGQAWGTYVLPSLRRQGIAQRLRDDGARRMADLGFARVVGGAGVPPEVAERIQALVKPQQPPIAAASGIELGADADASVQSGLGTGFVWESVIASMSLHVLPEEESR